MSRFSGCLVVLGTCNSWCHVGVCNSWIWDSEFHGSISLKGQFVGNTIESPPQGRQARKELKRMKLIKDKQDCWMAVPILVHHYIKIWNLPIFFEMRCSPKFTCLVRINYCLSSSILDPFHKQPSLYKLSSFQTRLKDDCSNVQFSWK